jgi:hypothetical protein
LCLAIIGTNKKIRFLIEVKAVSVALNDNHVKQAIDYGANAGVNWVILTNAERWIVYKIKFGKPIDKELVYEFNLLNLDGKSDKEMEVMFAISKEGQENAAIDDFYANIQVKNKYIIGNLLNTYEVYAFIRKIMKKIFIDVKITDEEIGDILVNDIIKREILDSDESKKARKDIERICKKLDKIKEKNKEIETGERPKTSEETGNFQSESTVPVQVHQDGRSSSVAAQQG